MRLYVKNPAGLALYFFPSDRSEKAVEVVEPANGKHAGFGISHFQQLIAEWRDKDYPHLGTIFAFEADGFGLVFIHFLGGYRNFVI